MARIRIIRPNFAQSSAMCRVSREARFLFVLLWTLADDAGRLRGDPNVLAGLLYACDVDAPALLPGWLEELARQGCVECYSNDGEAYLRIVHWRKLQTIDRPTPSRLPAPPSVQTREGSRGPHEESTGMSAECATSAIPREDFFDTTATVAEVSPLQEITEERLIDALERIRANSEADGVYTPALRAVELMGRNIGMWAGRRPETKKAAECAETASPPLRDVVRRPDTGNESV